MTMQSSPPNPYQFDPLNPQGEPRRGNTLGVTGFVFSLLGLILSCGTCAVPILAIVPVLGLLLSIMGMFRRPRGLAITGVIIGVLALLITIGGVIASFSFKALGGFMQVMHVGATSQAVMEYKRQNSGTLPPDLGTISGQIPPGWTNDKWGNSFIYEPAADNSSFTLRSAGPDATPDTADDVDFHDIVKSMQNR
jgi:hypothetical protein